MTQSPRIGYIDGTKAIGITLMVIGHSFCLMYGRHIPIQVLYRTIYSFHMPLFFLLAGYFSRKMPLGESVPKYAKAYLKPMAITCVLALLLLIADSLVRGKGFGFIIEQFKIWVYCILAGFQTTRYSYMISRPLLGPLWFLWALFLARVIHSFLLSKLTERNCTFAAAGLFLIVWLTLPFIPHLPLCIQASLMAVVFLHAGYIIRHYDVEKMFRNMRPIFHVAAVLVWVLCIHTRFNFKGLVFPFHFLHIIGGAVPTLYILWFCDRFHFNGGIVGKSTLCILCGHVLALQLEKYFMDVCACTSYYFLNFILEVLIIVIHTAVMSVLLYKTRLIRS